MSDFNRYYKCKCTICITNYVSDACGRSDIPLCWMCFFIHYLPLAAKDW